MEDGKVMQSSLDQELGKIKSRGLTLDPDAQEMPVLPQPSLSAIEAEQPGVSAGSIDESMLSDEEKRQVEEFARQIDITDVKLVNSYGAGAQKGISTFSSQITNNVKTKEFGDVGDSLRDLRAAINSTVTPQKKGLFGLFQKGKAKVTYVISNYESAETNIRKIEKDLQRHQQVLTKDVYISDQMYDMNL